MRGIIALVSDTHCNSLYGLMRPGVVLPPILDMEDNWQPQPTFAQARIHHWFMRDIARLKVIAGDDPIIVVHVGDVTHGNAFPRSECVSRRLFDQVVIAADSLYPLFNLENVIEGHFLSGTPIHVFNHGQASQMVARMLQQEVGYNIKTTNHLYLDAFGVKLDVAHHGPGPGSRSWLKGNTLRLYTLSLMEDALKEGDDPPHIVARAHQHRYVSQHVSRWARGKTHHTWATSLPGYILNDHWTRRISQSTAYVWIGMVAYEVINGKVLPPIELLRRIDFRKERIVDYGGPAGNQAAQG